MQVLFNVLFPDWLQTALLTVLLLFVINKTVRKGMRQWQQESKAIRQRQQEDQHASLSHPVHNFRFMDIQFVGRLLLSAFFFKTVLA